MEATAAPSGALRIDDLGSLRWYAPDDDPNVEYGFCATCGSSMFHRSGVVDGTTRHVSICAGSIDGPSGLRTAEIWFADEAGDHAHRDPTIPAFDGQPPPVRVTGS